jgi:hypothetical protein
VDRAKLALTNSCSPLLAAACQVEIVRVSDDSIALPNLAGANCRRIPDVGLRPEARFWSAMVLDMSTPKPGRLERRGGLLSGEVSDLGRAMLTLQITSDPDEPALIGVPRSRSSYSLPSAPLARSERT